jgi:hypothetical protein
VRIERLVADKSQACDAGHKDVEARNVVLLAWQKDETDKIAKRVDESRNLCGQTTARFANGLFLSPPFAPVPC